MLARNFRMKFCCEMWSAHKAAAPKPNVELFLILCKILRVKKQSMGLGPRGGKSGWGDEKGSLEGAGGWDGG